MKQIRIFTITFALAGLTSCYYYGPCVEGTGPVISEVRSLSGFTGVSNAASYEVYITRADNFYIEVKAQENLLPYIETFVSGSTLIIETQDDVCLRNSVPVRIYVSLPDIEVISLAGSGGIFSDIIEADDLEVILAGSGRILIDSIYGKLIVLGNSASGSIFSNYVDAIMVQANLSGSGSIESGIVIQPSNLTIMHSSSGTVRMTVEAASRIYGTLSGSGRILLYGDANESSFVNNGSGKIDALDMPADHCTATNSGSGNILVYVNEYLKATIVSSGDIVFRGDPELSVIDTGSGSLRRY